MTISSGAAPRTSRPLARRAAASTAALMAGAMIAASATPASATLTGPGVDAGQNITVFANIDMVAVFGFGPVGSTLTVEVFRGADRIGIASGPAVDGGDGPGLEVNHGPEGAVRPGDCWNGSTPDIRAKDRIVVTDAAGDKDEVTVDDIRFTGQPEGQANGDVVVRGVALRANGDPIPASFLDSAEFRNDSGKYRTTPTVEATPGVTGGFTLRYAPNYLREGRNRDGLSVAAMKAALLNEDGHSIGFGHTEPLPKEAMLVDGLTDNPGPAAGCPGGPAPEPDTEPFLPPDTNPVPGPADTAAPSVSKRTPGADATNVSRRANVTAVFSEAVTGVNRTTVKLRDTGGALVSATVRYSASTKTATLDPRGTLKARTKYTVTLTSGIKDAAGNPLGDTTWSFITRG